MSRATYLREATLKNLFMLCAIVAVAAVALILIFIGVRGWPVIQNPGLSAFLFGTEWSASGDAYGILPLITGTLVVTIGALLLGAPLAIGTAIFLSEIASPPVRRIVRPAVELLAGVPSVRSATMGRRMTSPKKP
jgi:phosphate transport system permease protein